MGKDAFILPSAGDSEPKPVIVIDNREQCPLEFRRLQSISGTLTTGDYSLAGCEEIFSIERKSIPDIVQCCIGDNRVRFERELHRLRGFRFKRLLIIGAKVEIESARYRSSIPPKSILATVSAFECRYDLPTIWIPCPEQAAQQVESWVFWYFREILKTADAIQKLQPKGDYETHQQPA